MQTLMQADNLAQTAAFLLLFTLVLVIVMAYLMSKQKALTKSMLIQSRRRFYSVIDCGGSQQVREFQPGDYVGKVLGPCGEGGQAWIIGIYSEEVKESTK
ncbi:MAG: hypothetical protein QXV55_05555 [Acidilobaceae archaeon]